MELEEYKKKLDEVLNNLQDQGKVTEILAELTTDYSEINGTLKVLEDSNKKLNEDSESLRAANMKLFLQIGSKPKEEDKPLDEPPHEDPPEKLRFEDLFNEKGGLK